MAEDKKSAQYELRVEGTTTSGKKINVEANYCISEVFDDKGYFHIRKANDFITEDIVQKLEAELAKSA